MKLLIKGKFIYIRVLIDRLLAEDVLLPQTRQTLDAIREALVEIEEDVEREERRIDVEEEKRSS
jgi:uncharacterized membrane protein